MNRENIQNLEQLLKQKIGNNQKISSTKISRLTAPGDNYGAVLLKVDVLLENTEGVREDLNVVAKTIPINPFLQKLFDIQLSVKKEIAIYDTVVPTLQQFQREQGIKRVIDFFPKLYGARWNLNGSDVIDENSVILLENLVNSGYKNVERTVGFDLETTKLILKDLATFHATPLALKISKPEVFEKKIKSQLTQIRRQVRPKTSENGQPVSTPNDVLQDFIKTTDEIRSLAPKLKDILDFHAANANEIAPRPFFTISHGDMWANNVMVKFENGKPVASKIVDFQNTAFRSPATDLLFFLWTSVQESLLEEHLDDLIKLYHEHFVETLIQLKCDPSPFSFKHFLDEIKIDFKAAALGQTIFMTAFVVLCKKGFLADEASGIPEFGTKEDISPAARERIIFLLNKSNEKGWL